MTRQDFQVAQPNHVKEQSRRGQFPKLLANGSQSSPSTSGEAAAALISAAFGCFLMMVNQHFTSVSKAWNEIIWSLGSWIPGSHNPDPLQGSIGSYTGKETILLLSWLVSWFILHRLWRDQQIKPRTIFAALFIFLVAATVMNWHPLFPYLPLMPK